VTIVIPIHNEASFLPDAVDRLLAELTGVDADVAVTLVENGSTDDTAEVAEGLADRHPRLRVIRLDRADYGAAMRAGFERAGGDWVVNFDIDYFSGRFLRAGLALADRADLVLASKRVRGAVDRRGLLRRFGTLGFNLLLKAMFRSRVSDTHGMKLVRREVVTEVVPSVISTQDLFDTELVIRAERAGYRIVEVPARVEELRTARSSYLARVPRTLVGLWRIRRALRRERGDSKRE
jgi:glycosyltransferase involved in cell wall biosynthesis